MTESATDFAVIAYREDERWETDVLPAVLTEDLSGLLQALRQQPSVGSTIGFVGVGDDFFIAIRVTGGEHTCAAGRAYSSAWPPLRPGGARRDGTPIRSRQTAWCASERLVDHVWYPFR